MSEARYEIVSKLFININVKIIRIIYEIASERSEASYE